MSGPRTALQEGNARYEARFGRVFLIRAKAAQRRSDFTGADAPTAAYRRRRRVTEALAQLREITMLGTEASDWRMSTLSTHILIFHRQAGGKA